MIIHNFRPQQLGPIFCSFIGKNTYLIFARVFNKQITDKYLQFYRLLNTIFLCGISLPGQQCNACRFRQKSNTMQCMPVQTSISEIPQSRYPSHHELNPASPLCNIINTTIYQDNDFLTDSATETRLTLIHPFDGQSLRKLSQSSALISS